jgi:hypothetical protein
MRHEASHKVNWDAIGAVAEILGAVAVLATLFYFAIQIGHLKKQNESDALDHVIDALNDFAGRIAESDSLASIIHQGRVSYESLSEEEKIRFDSIHMFLLNVLESWYLQEQQLERVMEGKGIENIINNITYFCDYPGFREFWDHAKPVYPHLGHLIDSTLGDA